MSLHDNTNTNANKTRPSPGCASPKRNVLSATTMSTILGEHVAAVDGLPAIHKDPFDRLLLAQASAEDMILLTADAPVLQYPGTIQSAHSDRNS